MIDTSLHELPSETSLVLPNDLKARACFTGLDSWVNFIARFYRYSAFRISTGGSQITGTLALVHVEHPLFGNYLVSAPFGSYGGFSFRTEADRDAILARAAALADERGVGYTLIRFEDGSAIPPRGWIQHPSYCTYILDLPEKLDSVLGACSSNHRNHIRKSLKQGMSIRFGHLDLLDDSYEGIARGMHELGSPFHRMDYLRSMAEALGPALSFAAVYDHKGQIAGGGIFITHGSTVTNLYGNILRRFRAHHVGEFLYWSVIEHYHALGFRTFDMGRSLVGSGNEVFKMKWKPRRQQLAYWYHLRTLSKIPELNQKNPKLQAMIWMWKRMPRPFVRALGPHLIKGIA